LLDYLGTVDYTSEGAQTFTTNAKGALLGINDAHNGYKAIVQAVFYVVGLIGDITIGVNYRNENGKIKTKSRTYHGPVYIQSSSGGWSDPQYVYSELPTPATWSSIAAIDESNSALTRLTKRIPLQMNVIASEVQWFISTPDAYSDFLLRAVSFEGENLGVKPDLR